MSLRLIKAVAETENMDDFHLGSPPGPPWQCGRAKDQSIDQGQGSRRHH